MKRVLCVSMLLAAALALGMGAASAAEVKVGDHTISGPYSHGNLSIYLVHGQDKLRGDFVPLHEALERGGVVVHETDDVNRIIIENKSGTVNIYIQSGVIIKGGKQDRTIKYDVIIRPERKVPVDCFCVESGRWRQRGGEAADKFGSARSNLATKELKLAAKQAGDQREVWSNVKKAQDKLESNLGQPVQAKESASSLQLTLENKKLRETAAEYTAALSRAIAGQKNVIGFAFAVSGEMNSADVYASQSLFQKMLPGLLEASAVEAIAKEKKGEKFAVPDPDAVRALLLDAQDAQATQKDVAENSKVVIQETGKSILFRSLHGSDAVHENYIKK